MRSLPFPFLLALCLASASPLHAQVADSAATPAATPAPDSAAVGVPVNMGPAVNCPNADTRPIVSPDGNTLYFVRRHFAANLGEDKSKGDIYVSIKGADGTWGPARNMGPPLNTPGPNGVISISPDGQSLLVLNIYNPDGTLGSGISSTVALDTTWTTPKPLDIKLIRNNSQFGDYYLGASGKELLVSIEGDDSYGGADLYVSFRRPDGAWGEPRNLGSRVNGAEDDFAPHLAADGVTLYFTSARPGGLGGWDIWVTRRLDDTWVNWSEPANLGAPTNSPGDEAYYSIAASGREAYFAKVNPENNSDDIYRVALPPAARPRAVVLLSGRVLNAKTRAPIEAQVVYSALPEGNELGFGLSSKTDGEYAVTLPAGQLYGILAEARGFLSESANLDLTELADYQEVRRDLLLVPVEVGERIRLNNIFFETGKADLLEASNVELDRVAGFLAKSPSLQIEIGGHTDDVGPEAANAALSQARARAVAQYLEGKGIAPLRLKYKGYGESRPIAANDSEANRAQNRRVEFTILGL